jgi:DNA excision repair protein ERCC-2
MTDTTKVTTPTKATDAVECDAPTYAVAIRALCEFAAKRGDLDLRFTPSPSAQEGIAGHTLVAKRRQDGYESEISLSGCYENLEVRGRADGYCSILNQLEEVKTYRGYIENMPINHRALHWAQAKCYAWLMCVKLGLSEMNVALVYFNIETETETVLVEKHKALDLRDTFETLCSTFVQWASQELVHRHDRDARLAALNFPFDQLHSGQRVLAESVYRAGQTGRCLLAQAPTGIGKTLGTLFPLLKVAPTKLDKIFYLTAKTSGRAMALEALALLQKGYDQKPLRVVELVAREKACEHPDKACNGDSCPLAKGFYDKLPSARSAALCNPLLDKSQVRSVALNHGVCPYYLSQELVRWADIVVCDYNYYFDLNAMLYALMIANQWRVSVLVDEAHNLLDRARSMYTAEVTEQSLLNLRADIPQELKKDVDRLMRQWRKLFNNLPENYNTQDELPEKVLAALSQLTTAIAKFLGDVDQQNVVDYPAAQSLFFDSLHFQKVAELFGSHSFVEIEKFASTPFLNRLCIRNVLPAPLIKYRFAAAQSCTLFSATLNPPHAYLSSLGLPENTVVIDVPTPFTADQLRITVLKDISTRFKDRKRTLSALVAAIVQQFDASPGNYLAFFSSFDYLQLALKEVQKLRPEIPFWEQTRSMPEGEREAFLAKFTSGGKGIGFAVLGGAFSEGIDLTGTRLIGAFIATLGLPQINQVNEQMKLRLEKSVGQGYEHAYLYPGIQKVVQAAGRVIRTQQDRGFLYLMDDRFASAQVKSLLPSWWDVEVK